MIPFGEAQQAAAQRLIAVALEEDLGEQGDLTCEAILPESLEGQAQVVSRAEGVLAGLPVVASLVQYFVKQGGEVTFEPKLKEGSSLQQGTVIGVLTGRMRDVLSLERTALNFLQRLSGVATLTAKYVATLGDLPCKIFDTRKTTPGWRLLEKHAVQCGGGTNHRMGLYDAVMIKDNHLAALSQVTSADATVTSAVTKARAQYSQNVEIVVEVDNLQQFDEALQCDTDVILLDNMSLDDLRECVRRRDEIAPSVVLEASGGVTLVTVGGIAETGVDRISVGALTHSAPALDIALDYQFS